MANGSVAPVCPISRDQPVPGSPGITIPFYPFVYDLPSAIAALNQMNNIIKQLGPGIPQPALRGPRPLSSGPSQDSGKQTKVHFTEESRETERVDICNPDGDPDTDFVTVTRITRVVFSSPGTLIKLEWNLRP